MSSEISAHFVDVAGGGVVISLGFILGEKKVRLFTFKTDSAKKASDPAKTVK
jgi:hypothetical protein